MTLLNARQLYTENLAKLILYCIEQGYEVAIAQDGLKHMKGSLHYIGLADDLYLYKNDEYLTGTPSYKFAGDYWKSLDPGNTWGGDFTNSDGNHFSYGWGGRR